MAHALVVLVRPKAVPLQGPLPGTTTHRRDGGPVVPLPLTTPAVLDESTVEHSISGAALDAHAFDVELNARTSSAAP